MSQYNVPDKNIGDPFLAVEHNLLKNAHNDTDNKTAANTTALSELGTASRLDVPSTAGEEASAGQVVRGDDPRLQRTEDAIEVILDGTTFTLPTAVDGDVHNFTVAALPLDIQSSEPSDIAALSGIEVQDQLVALPTSFDVRTFEVAAEQPNNAPDTVFWTISDNVVLGRSGDGHFYNQAAGQSNDQSGNVTGTLWRNDTFTTPQGMQDSYDGRIGSNITSPEYQNVFITDTVTGIEHGPFQFTNWQGGGSGGGYTVEEVTSVTPTPGWTVQRVTSRIDSVTGSAVDNSDPRNPVIDTPESINFLSGFDSQLAEVREELRNGVPVVCVADTGGTFASIQDNAGNFPVTDLQNPGHSVYLDFTFLRSGGVGADSTFELFGLTAEFAQFTFNIQSLATSSDSGTTGEDPVLLHLSQTESPWVRCVVEFPSWGAIPTGIQRFRFRPAGDGNINDVREVCFRSLEIRTTNPLTQENLPCVAQTIDTPASDWTTSGGITGNTNFSIGSAGQQDAVAEYAYAVPVGNRGTKHTFSFELGPVDSAGNDIALRVEVEQGGTVFASRDLLTDETTQSITLNFVPTADVIIRISDTSTGSQGSNRDASVSNMQLIATCETLSPNDGTPTLGEDLLEEVYIDDSSRANSPSGSTFSFDQEAPMVNTTDGLRFEGTNDNTLVVPAGYDLFLSGSIRNMTRSATPSAGGAVARWYDVDNNQNIGTFANVVPSTATASVAGGGEACYYERTTTERRFQIRQLTAVISMAVNICIRARKIPKVAVLPELETIENVLVLSGTNDINALLVDAPVNFAYPFHSAAGGITLTSGSGLGTVINGDVLFTSGSASQVVPAGVTGWISKGSTGIPEVVYSFTGETANSENTTNWPGSAGETLTSNGDGTFTFT